MSPRPPPDPNAADRRLWRDAGLFAGAPPSALAALADASTPFRASAGQFLFQRGDPGDTIYLLAKGRIKLALLSAQGRELVLRHAEAGDFLGEIAFFDRSLRSTMAVALCDCQGLLLTRDAYLKIAPDQRSDLNAAVITYLCQRLRETTDQLESISLFELPGRLARFILFRLVQLNGPDLPPDPALDLGMTQGELAAILGASRPKVNRALQELEAGGAIRREGQVLYCDSLALQAAAAGIEA